MAQRRRQRDTGQRAAAARAGAAGSSEDDDNGEGCSYSWADARDAYSSNVTAGSPNSEEACWCGNSVASTTRQRKRRAKCSVTSTKTSLALLAASIPFLPLAQAVPVEPTTEKGKGRAAMPAQDDVDYSDRYIYADTATYHHQSSNNLADIFSSNLDAGYSEKPAHRVIRSKRGTAAAANPPGPAAILPGHYVYVDGQWVPSTDWSLNGREGAQDASPVTSNSASEGVASGQGVDESLLQPQISIDSGEDSSALEANPDDLDEDSLGWAPTTNAMLGVDLEATRTVASSSTSSNTQTGLPIRTNMAHLSSASSSASSVASATSSSTTSNGIVAYDFSHDVPNGWVNDGRTPAYAVPVIIGVSVVLAIIIFTLVLFFVRGARKRKRRRKYGMKLQEEGDMPSTRPTSPSSQDQADGDEQDMSRGARAPNGEIVYDEKKKQRIISRRWSLAGGQQSLRKRRGKIAKLLNRKGPIVEEVVPSSTTPAHQRTSSRQTSPLRRRTLSQQSQDGSARIGSATEGSQSAEAEESHESNTTSRSRSPILSASMARDASTTSSVTDDAPLQSTAEAARLSSSGASPRPPMLQLPQQAPSLLQPTQDLYNVPVPVVGPPAYIHPPSPAYTSNSLDAHQAGYFADEKRALLNHTPAQSGSNAVTGSSSDPYRQQRRYEHLYTSRDGEDAEREQRTGAPHAGPSSSGSAFRIQSEEDEEEESQQPMRAHIAVDDKGLLNRIREAASAPSQPPSTTDIESAPESILGASAPPLALEMEEEEELQVSQAKPSSSARSFLPAPPRPVATSLSAIPPLLDEKTRLRQAEEQQAAYMLSPDQPSEPDFASSSAHEPSAPDFDVPYGSEAASAPPLDEEDVDASAPPLPEVDDDDDHHFSNRPHLEGIV